MPAIKRPNLFIVGAQKSGTSAMAGWLSRHPQVFMSFPKEPGYLAFGEKGYVYPDGYGKPAPACQYVVSNRKTYLDLFSTAGASQRVIGEASTWYLPHPEAAGNIKSLNPRAKIIAILRNPMERAYSAWCHARSDNLEPCEDFAEALQLEAARGEVEYLLRYHRMGLYSEDIERYRQLFGDKQILILLYEDIKGNPEGMWQKVCEFLGLEADYTPEFNRQYNRSGNPRLRFLHRLARSHSVKATLRRFIPHRPAIWLKNSMDNFNLERFPPMDDKTRKELALYYASDIDRLGAILERDLGAWVGSSSSVETQTGASQSPTQ